MLLYRRLHFTADTDVVWLLKSNLSPVGIWHLASETTCAEFVSASSKEQFINCPCPCQAEGPFRQGECCWMFCLCGRDSSCIRAVVCSRSPYDLDQAGCRNVITTQHLPWSEERKGEATLGLVLTYTFPPALKQYVKTSLHKIQLQDVWVSCTGQCSLDSKNGRVFVFVL